MDDGTTPALGLKLSAMLLRLWTRKVELLDGLVEAQSLATSGFIEIRPGLYAIIATSGDAAVAEAGFRAANRLFRASPAGIHLAALLFPGEITLSPGQAQVVPSPFLEDLNRAPAELESRVVHFTGHAAHELESRWRLTDCGTYRGASGREVPISKLDQPAPDTAPWRNPELFGRSIETVSRSALFEALYDHQDRPAFLVSGPLGSGKTRAVWQALSSDDAPTIWTRSWSARSGGPSIAKQLLRGLLQSDAAWGADAHIPPQLHDPITSWWAAEGGDDAQVFTNLLADLLDRASTENPAPIRFVCDSFETATGADRDTVARLLELPRLGRVFRLVLIGRNLTLWPDACNDLPTVSVPPLSPSIMAALCERLFTGLSVPQDVVHDFLGATLGFPFALEEGVIQLIRRRIVRRLYGNFFYAGGDDTSYQPSPRLSRHLEAETLRLGDPTPLRILSVTGMPVPEQALSATATELGHSTTANWSEPFRQAELVRLTDSPWGPALAMTSAAYSRALAVTVAKESRPSPRHVLGQNLAAMSDDSAASWHAYRLLAGTPEAVPALLRVARSPSVVVPQELFDALAEELEAHHERQGDEATELDLLWQLLPLARRLGGLRSVRDALKRAIELAESDPERLLALTALKAEQDQNDGRFQEAERSILRALELAKSTDDRRKALLLIELAKLLQRHPDKSRYPEARKHFEELVVVLDDAGNTTLAATCRFHLGNIALVEKRLEAALEYHEIALEERRGQGLTRQIGASLSALGTVMLALGDYPKALGNFQEAEEMLSGEGREVEVSEALLGVGRALSRLGAYTAASQPFRRALANRQDRDDQTGEALARLVVAENHLHLEQADLALDEARKAHFNLSLVDAAKQLGDAEQLLGRIRLQQRQFPQAAGHLRSAIAKHQEHGDILAATFDRAWLLEAAIASDDEAETKRLCTDLLAVLETLRYPELGEMLDLRLHQGLCWLNEHTAADHDPLPPLRRAYAELYRKTALLSSELRNRFLFQIQDNRAILNAATENGLSLDELSSR